MPEYPANGSNTVAGNQTVTGTSTVGGSSTVGGAFSAGSVTAFTGQLLQSKSAA